MFATLFVSANTLHVHCALSFAVKVSFRSFHHCNASNRQDVSAPWASSSAVRRNIYPINHVSVSPLGICQKTANWWWDWSYKGWTTGSRRRPDNGVQIRREIGFFLMFTLALSRPNRKPSKPDNSGPAVLFQAILMTDIKRSAVSELAKSSGKALNRL